MRLQNVVVVDRQLFFVRNYQLGNLLFAIVCSSPSQPLFRSMPPSGKGSSLGPWRVHSHQTSTCYKLLASQDGASNILWSPLMVG